VLRCTTSWKRKRRTDKKTPPPLLLKIYPSVPPIFFITLCGCIFPFLRFLLNHPHPLSHPPSLSDIYAIMLGVYKAENSSTCLVILLTSPFIFFFSYVYPTNRIPAPSLRRSIPIDTPLPELDTPGFTQQKRHSLLLFFLDFVCLILLVGTWAHPLLA
jgi:hypothetical protein